MATMQPARYEDALEAQASSVWTDDRDPLRDSLPSLPLPPLPLSTCSTSPAKCLEVTRRPEFPDAPAKQKPKAAPPPVAPVAAAATDTPSTTATSSSNISSTASNRRHGPIVHRWNPVPCVLLALFMPAAAYYLYTRITSLSSVYSGFILACELLGLSSFIPYATLLLRGVYPSGSPGLPPSPSLQPGDTRSDARFSVHVLIPCYKEGLDVVSGTVQAALDALLPAGVRRTVYLLDDGGDSHKRAYVEAFASPEVQYITGRERKPGQMNGKSENLNHALRTCVFPSPSAATTGEGIDWRLIPNNELVVVFDADMRAKPDFFLKTLEVMADESLQLVLTPQAFHNIHPDADLFNNINAQFWEYWLPGAFAWGYIACTGTNFAIRARALACCGWFPNHTVTEDYALGMELKKRGFQATYLMEYLAEGEAPEDVRQIFQQRSRWTKGHYQVFFSRANPLFVAGLPFFQRLWYCYASWAPFCNMITTPVFMLVPLMSIGFGYHPVTISYQYVLAATLYFLLTFAIQFYVRSLRHLKASWFVSMCNTLLFFTQWKAFVNSLVASVGAKDMTFKVTAKNKPTGSPASKEAQRLLVRRRQETALASRQPLLLRPSSQSWASSPTQERMRSLSHIRTKDAHGHVHPLLADESTPTFSTTSTGAASCSSGEPLKAHPAKPSCPPAPCKAPRHSTPGSSSTPGAISTPKTIVAIAPTPRGADSSAAGPKQGASRLVRLHGILASFRPRNIRDVAAMADPAVLILMLLLSLATGAVGIWQMTLATPGSSRFMFGGVASSPFLAVATLWAFCNAAAPLLFVHYCWTAGDSFRSVAKWLYTLTSLTVMVCIILLWLVIPISVRSSDALDLAIQHLYPSSVAHDNNTHWSFVTGRDMQPLQVSGQHDLTGGLLTSDHAKYAMPMSYTLTMLSWAMLKFPGAFVGREAGLLDTLRQGAEYLMRCDLSGGSGDGPLFVAQVGDGALYTVVGDPGFDPVASGKVWTAPWEDPQLVGNATRPVWVMTKDSLGVDVLADAAAALAAVGAVFKPYDAAFSQQAITKARQLFKFATDADDGRSTPKSYCQFVPCTTNVTVKETILTRKVTTTMSNTSSGSPTIASTCYYLDWITRTCHIGSTLEACKAVASVNSNVYTDRMDCCNVLYSLDYTAKPQGICAVPEGQWSCYIPLQAQRTCVRQDIDPATGMGCTGKGLEIFTNELACCESLSSSGVVDPTQGRDATGICAKSVNSTDTCWVPDMSQGTCQQQQGWLCTVFGLETSYDTTIACCNRLIQMLNSNMQLINSEGTPLTGVCARQPPPPPSTNGAAPSRLLLDAGSTPVPSAASAPPASQSLDLNASTWQLPAFMNASMACKDGACELKQVTIVKEVPLYNSTMVLDDMAWGAVWLYKATGDPSYLGMAERYLTRHYREDINEETLQRDRSYYTSNWNNVAWVTNVLLADATQGAPSKYGDRVRTFLRSWLTGDPVERTDSATKYGHTSPSTALENFTDADTGALYLVIPACVPTSTYENDCYDGVDNDCNGQVDRLDAACGLFPVLYTPRNLPFSMAPVLPNAANAAFLAMLYAELDEDAADDVRCWALGQATYMLGGTQSIDSFVVGYGPNPPTILQHRASSCPVQPSCSPGSSCPTAPCSWDSAFFPEVPNPQLDLVKGALVWGPSGGTDYPSNLRTSDDTRVRLEDNVGMTGLLAALVDRGTKAEHCSLGHGVWQRYIWTRPPV